MKFQGHIKVTFTGSGETLVWDKLSSTFISILILYETSPPIPRVTFIVVGPSKVAGRILSSQEVFRGVGWVLRKKAGGAVGTGEFAPPVCVSIGSPFPQDLGDVR